jgi:hypothetical protein
MEKNNVCEVGFKLDRSLDFYHDMLIKFGFENVYNCETRDIYWSNKNFDGMSENEIKRSCVRFRYSRGFGGSLYERDSYPKSGFQNYLIFDNLAENSFMCPFEDVDKFEEKFNKYYWKKVFDTKKVDYQYSIKNMKSRIQIQDIDGIGLVLYYDNPDYYDLPILEQRNKLIEELNSYGFSFKYNELGIDKLRTLYYKKECFSENQNG